MWEHGTRNGYTHHGCRCEECRAAKAASYREWRHRNSQRVAAYLREWRRRDPYPQKRAAASRARAKKWRQANPDKARELGRRRLAAAAGAPGTNSTAQRQSRWNYYGGLCWMCGAAAEAMDHVIPLSRGGSDWPSNLRPACTSCNSRKRDRRWEVA